MNVPDEVNDEPQCLRFLCIVVAGLKRLHVSLQGFEDVLRLRQVVRQRCAVLGERVIDEMVVSRLLKTKHGPHVVRPMRRSDEIRGVK